MIIPDILLKVPKFSFLTIRPAFPHAWAPENLKTWRKFLESKDTAYKEIIGEKDEKFKIVDGENKNLRDDIHKLKTKNTIIEIVAGVLIASLTYVQFFLQW